jgi:hypothetical protein
MSMSSTSLAHVYGLARAWVWMHWRTVVNREEWNQYERLIDTIDHRHRPGIAATMVHTLHNVGVVHAEFEASYAEVLNHRGQMFKNVCQETMALQQS